MAFPQLNSRHVASLRVLRSPLLSLPVVLFLAACGSSPVADMHTADTPVSAAQHAGEFEEASLISEDELSRTRGGFIVEGGLKLNFGLQTSSFINGMVQTNLNLSSNGLNGAVPQNLQQLVQVGSGNQFSTGQSSSTLNNNVLTLVQNTVNNTVIQNKNVLNLSISNIGQFHDQIALANNLFSRVNALH